MARVLAPLPVKTIFMRFLSMAVNKVSLVTNRVLMIQFAKVIRSKFYFKCTNYNSEKHAKSNIGDNKTRLAETVGKRWLVF